MHTRRKLSESPWIMGLLAGVLTVAGHPRAVAADANAKATAEAVRCAGGPDEFVPDDDPTAVESSEGPSAASASREFAGVTCQGGPTKATSRAEATLERMKLTNILRVESTGPSTVYPFAGASASLFGLYLLTNHTDAVKRVPVRLAIGGSIDDVAETCESSTPYNQPCFLATFQSNLFNVVDEKNKPFDASFIQIRPDQEPLRIYAEVPLTPGGIFIYPVGLFLKSAVYVRGRVTIGTGNPLTIPARAGFLPQPPRRPFSSGVSLYFVLPDGVRLEGEQTSGLPGSAFADAVLRPGQAVPTPEPSVTVSPPSGPLLATQAFDLALIVQTQGQEIASVAATLDGADVSTALAACSGAAGSLTGGTAGQVLRCPGLTGAFLGAGSHTLDVTVTLTGGSVVGDTAVWEVLANGD